MYREPAVTGMKLGPNNLEQKEERNIETEQNEETRFKNMRRGLGTSGTTLNVPTSKS